MSQTKSVRPTKQTATNQRIKRTAKRPVARKAAVKPAGQPSGRFWRLRAFVRQHTILVIIVLLFAVAGVSYIAFTHAATPAGAIRNGVSTCLDNKRNNFVNSNPVQLYTCNGGAGQQWSVESDGTIRTHGYCLDAKRAGTKPMTPVQIYSCNGGGNQRWRVSGSQIINVNANLCLDDKRNNPANSAPVQLYNCNGGIGQQWMIASAATATPVTSKSLYVWPDNHAGKQATAWATSNPLGAAYMRKLAQVPIPIAIGRISTTALAGVTSTSTQAASQGTIPMYTTDYFSNVNCGNSATDAAKLAGVRDNAKAFTDYFVNGLAGRSAIIIFEARAFETINNSNCYQQIATSSQVNTIMANMVHTLRTQTNARIYLGLPSQSRSSSAGVNTASAAAARLNSMGLADANGFIVGDQPDVVNSDIQENWAKQVNAALNNTKRYIINSSLVGITTKPPTNICNPTNVHYGTRPAYRPDQAGTYSDGYLWLTDGGFGNSGTSCTDSAPGFGSWLPDLALTRMRNAGSNF